MASHRVKINGKSRTGPRRATAGNGYRDQPAGETLASAPRTD